MGDVDNGQLLDMDSSDQQTSQIDSEMDSQQSSSQDYHPQHHHHHHHHAQNDLSTQHQKRQSTESSSSSVVGKYWRSKSLPVAYLPPLQNTPDPDEHQNKSDTGKDKEPRSKRGSSCRNCRGGSSKHKSNKNCGGGKCARCCRGSDGSANSHGTANNGKVKSLGGGSSAEQVLFFLRIKKN